MIVEYGFTFHYVSILIFIGLAVGLTVGVFTFHYVSILILEGAQGIAEGALYIPLCLYFNNPFSCHPRTTI